MTAAGSAENREGSLRSLGALHGAYPTSKRTASPVKQVEQFPPAIDTAGGGPFAEVPAP